MKVLMQLNEIAISLTNLHDHDHRYQQQQQQQEEEGDLELAAQFLNIALNHASGVVRNLMECHRANTTHHLAATSSSVSSSSYTNNSNSDYNHNESGTTTSNSSDDSNEQQQQQQQLLQIKSFHETYNSVCLLWYNLSLIRSRQRRWAEAKSNLSIVASMSNDVFLYGHALPLIVYVDTQILREQQQQQQQSCTSGLMFPKSNTILQSNMMYQQPYQQQYNATTTTTTMSNSNNNPALASQRLVLQSLQATTAVLGTVFHTKVASLLKTLGQVVCSSTTTTTSTSTGTTLPQQQQLHRQRQHNLAVAILDVGLTIERTVYHPTDATILDTLSTMVTLYASLGKTARAYQCLQDIQQLQIQRGESPQTIASTVWEMGVLQYSLGESGGGGGSTTTTTTNNDYPAALQHFLQALALLRSSSSSTAHREIAATLNSIGFVLLRMNRHATALGFCTEALSLLQQHQQQQSSLTTITTTTSTTTDIFRTLYHIGLLHSEMGHVSLALSYLEQAVEIVQRQQQQQTPPPVIIEPFQLPMMFLAMAKLAFEEESDPQRALGYCHHMAQSLTTCSILQQQQGNNENNINATSTTRKCSACGREHTVNVPETARQYWMQLALMRFSCGDVTGGLESCVYVARKYPRRNHDDSSFMLPEDWVAAYYVSGTQSKAFPAACA